MLLELGIVLKLDPEGGPLRHETRPGAKADEHHRNRDALLPARAQANFLLGRPHQDGHPN
jgi:hypothetical protein